MVLRTHISDIQSQVAQEVSQVFHGGSDLAQFKDCVISSTHLQVFISIFAVTAAWGYSRIMRLLYYLHN